MNKLSLSIFLGNTDLSINNLKIFFTKYNIIYINIYNLINFNIFKDFFKTFKFIYNEDEYSKLKKKTSDKRYYYKLYYLYIILSEFMFVAVLLKNTYDNNIFYNYLLNIIDKIFNKSLIIINKLIRDENFLNKLINKLHSKLELMITDETIKRDVIKYLEDITYYINNTILRFKNDTIKIFNFNFILELYALLDLFDIKYKLVAFGDKKTKFENMISNNYSKYINFYYKLSRIQSKYISITENDQLVVYKNIIKFLQDLYKKNNQTFIESKNSERDQEFNDDYVIIRTQYNNIEKMYNIFLTKYLLYNLNYIFQIINSSLVDEEILRTSIRLTDQKILDIIKFNYRYISLVIGNDLKLSDILSIINTFYDSIKYNLKDRERKIDIEVIDHIYFQSIYENIRNYLEINTIMNIKTYYYNIQILYEYFFKNIIDNKIISNQHSLVRSDSVYNDFERDIISIVNNFIIRIKGTSFLSNIKNEIIDLIKDTDFIKNYLSRLSLTIDRKNNIYKYYISNVYAIITNYIRIYFGYSYYLNIDTNNPLDLFLKEKLLNGIEITFVNNNNNDKLKMILKMFYKCFIDFSRNIINFDKSNTNKILENMQFDAYFTM